MTFANLHLIDWLVIIIFLIANLIIGLVYTRKGGDSLSSYFLSGRHSPLLPFAQAAQMGYAACCQLLLLHELERRPGLSYSVHDYNLICQCADNREKARKQGADQALHHGDACRLARRALLL